MKKTKEKPKKYLPVEHPTRFSSRGGRNRASPNYKEQDSDVDDSLMKVEDENGDDEDGGTLQAEDVSKDVNKDEEDVEDVDEVEEVDEVLFDSLVPPSSSPSAC